ncbi:MAG: helix-turn-helix transcriptional regulator [Armatimonas sp.]
MNDTGTYSNLWDLTVLCLLREKPMHPYEMQRLLKVRHKDDVLVLKKGSLYHAIHRLTKARFIEEIETARVGRRPERTTYSITDAGRAQHKRWLEELISTPRREPNSFMASVSFLVYLEPDDAATQLEARVERLTIEVTSLESALREVTPNLLRIHTVESEYLLALYRAELTWVSDLLADIRSERLTWNLEQILTGLHK